MKRYVLRTIKKPYRYVDLYWRLNGDIYNAQIYRKSSAIKLRGCWNNKSHWREKGLVDVAEIEIRGVSNE
jgi:hypothetical protein